MASSFIDARVREALVNFSGRLPLFPLPGVVLFPMTVLPLHIFEPRYRAMARHAIDGEKLIGMALLAPGWESDYEGRPAVHPMVCAGRLIHVAESPNGTFDILLEGLTRARVLSEEPGGAFRVAKVEIVSEAHLATEDEGLWRQRLDMMLVQVAPEVAAPIRKVLGTLMNSQLPLGTILDLIAHALPAAAPAKQQVLEGADVEARARCVLELLSRSTIAAPDDRPKRPAE